MTEQTARRKRVAPYVPASTMSAFFDHIRYVQTPKKVDTNIVQDYGISKGHAFALISAIKFLGLTDDRGIPMPVFRDLQTGGEEFKATLAELLKQSYADLFSRLDVSRDSRDKIVNFFARNYSPATAERATALFLDLCGEAGIATEAKPRAKTPHNRNEVRTVAPAHSQTVEQAAPNEPPGQPIKNTDITDSPKNGHGATGDPVINIRIDSKDIAAMNAQQITALFEGLRRIGRLEEKTDGEE